MFNINPDSALSGCFLTQDCNWKPRDTIHEIVTAVYSLVTLDSLIRPEYYGSRAILWVLHELKWLAPACGEYGFSQKKNLKELIDHLLEYNRQKAKSSLHPLTYTEVRTECFVFLDARVAMMCASGSAMDLYAGKSEATPSGNNGVSDTAKLKNELNSLR